MDFSWDMAGGDAGEGCGGGEAYGSWKSGSMGAVKSSGDDVFYDLI